MKHLDTCKKAKRFVDDRLRYKRMPDAFDHPQAIYKRVLADCQHFAICYMYELIRLDPYLENVCVYAMDIDFRDYEGHVAVLVMDTQKPFWSFLPWVSDEPEMIYHVLEPGRSVYRITLMDSIRRYEWRYNWKDLEKKIGVVNDR